jgi:hypothetical protein
MKKAVTHKSEQLYSFLLSLYPARFTQQFGEEMKFVFSESLRDAYEQDGSKGIFILLGWTCVDLFTSLFNEHLKVRKADHSMTSARFVSVRNAALVGLLVVVPFILLEAINTSGFSVVGIPLALFLLMWMFAAIFFLILMPLVRTIRAGNIALANPLWLALKVIFMALIVWLWVSLVIDQMPCFLGVPNCD